MRKSNSTYEAVVNNESSFTNSLINQTGGHQATELMHLV
jgi:hypothetical protein